MNGTDSWIQKKISLRPVSRGCHLVTNEILAQTPELQKFYMGMCFLQLLHTSASLILNENWDPDVREDVETYFTKLVPTVSFFCHRKWPKQQAVDKTLRVM